MNITDIFPGTTTSASNVTIPNSSIIAYTNGDNGQQLTYGILQTFDNVVSTGNLNNLKVATSSSLISNSSILQKKYTFTVNLDFESSVLDSINTLDYYSINQDAQNWYANVISNGGSVSESTLLAVSDFCNSIDDAGLRGKFLRLNLFCGNNVEACLTPLYRGPSFGGSEYGFSIDQNIGPFGSVDYSESSGLSGDNFLGSYLNTGLNSLTPFTTMGIAYNNIHASVYLSGLGTTEAWMSGVIGGNVFGFESGEYAGVTAFWGFGQNSNWNSPSGSYLGNSSCSNEGLIVANLKSGNNTFSIENNNCTSTSNVSSVSGDYTGTAIYIMQGPYGMTVPGNPEPTYSSTDDTVAGYSLGLGLTSSEMTDYYNIMTTFQTALERNI